MLISACFTSFTLITSISFSFVILASIAISCLDFSNAIQTNFSFSAVFSQTIFCASWSSIAASFLACISAISADFLLFATSILLCFSIIDFFFSIISLTTVEVPHSKSLTSINSIFIVVTQKA